MLVLTDTFSGWMETFPTQTKTALEFSKALLKEIIPWFGVPKSIQSHSGSTFVSQITKGVSRAPGIKWGLHSETTILRKSKTNQTLKRNLAKLCQDTHQPWIALLPIALLRM